MKSLRIGCSIVGTAIALWGTILGGMGVVAWLDVYRFRTATPDEISRIDPASHNFHLIDAVVDVDHGIEDNRDGLVYVPIHSKSHPDRPAPILLVESHYALRDLKDHPEVIKLDGPITDVDSTEQIPTLDTPLDRHLSTLWMGRHTPGLYETSTMVLGAGIMLLSISLWLILVVRPLKRNRTKS